MKRGAEKYLTDRNFEEDEGGDDDDEVEVTGGSEGFKQAAATELAKRPMRGLPGRRSGSQTPTNGTPKTAFTSGSPAPTANFSFGGNAASPAPAAPTNGFSFGSPAGSSTAPSSNGNDKDAEVTYYTSLRGLNQSVLTPLQRVIEKDAFADLSEVLDKLLGNYKKERRQIEEKHKAAASQKAAKPAAPASAAPAQTKSASMPMFSFNPQAAAPASPASSTNTSNPASSAPKPFSGFSFGGSSATTSTSTPPASSTPAKSPAEPAAPASSSSSAPKPFAGFSFTPSTPTSTSSPQSKEAANPTPAAAAADQPKKTQSPVPPAPPASFSFAGYSFKPDPRKTELSSSPSATPQAGAFVFNPTKADSSESSKFSFPASTSSTSSKADVEAPTSNLSPEPQQNAKSPASLSGHAAPFLPAGNSRARQPSPLRQVETFPAEAEKAKKVGAPQPAAAAAPKPFSGFSFGGAAPASTSTPAASGTPAAPKTTAFGSGASTSPKSNTSFAFGSSQGSPKGFTSNVGFSFGSSPVTTPAATPAADASTSASTKPPAFGGFSGFGTSAASGSSAPAFGAPASGSTPAFGASSSTTSAFGAPASGSSSAFGAPSGSAPAFGGFGGFAFKAPGAAASSAPAFGTSASTSTNGTPAASEGGGDADAEVSEAQEPSENTLLKGGAGEEDEETLYEARAKLWKHEDKGGGSGEKTWNDHGISILKINKNNATGKIRILGRSDANGRVQINFGLFKDLSVKLEKNFLSFMAFDAGNPQLMRLKLKNAELAEKLKAAIEKEVSAL